MTLNPIHRPPRSALRIGTTPDVRERLPPCAGGREGRPLGMVSARDALELETAEFEATFHQREHLRTIMA
ncbi:MAG: hypothetical protein IPL59_05880 [Candidatus Competibacteraceae bacterium]|nr:hypothetical protein [Candidatus Competibacteraceae bacterium]